MAEEDLEPTTDASDESSGGSGAKPAGSRALEMPEIELPDGSVVLDPASAVDLLGDVDLDVKIELGRCRMQVGDVLRLQQGSVVELDKLAGDPVDVYVNERLVARGEVLVVNDNFCVRVNEVLSAEADNK